MAYNRIQAKKICNATELDHFNQSLSPALGALSAAQLRSRIAKVRTLRDKYADLFRRQSLSTRAATGSKAGPTGAANERTAQKAQLLGETLARFEAQLAKVEAQAERRPSSANAKSPTKAAVARAPARPAAPKDSARKRALAQRAAKTEAAPLVLDLKAAVAAAVSNKRPAHKPTTPKAPGPAPAPTRGNPISPVVRVRGKEIGAHARTAGGRVQAKRDGR